MKEMSFAIQKKKSGGRCAISPPIQSFSRWLVDRGVDYDFTGCARECVFWKELSKDNEKKNKKRRKEKRQCKTKIINLFADIEIYKITPNHSGYNQWEVFFFLRGEYHRV